MPATPVSVGGNATSAHRRTVPDANTGLRPYLGRLFGTSVVLRDSQDGDMSAIGSIPNAYRMPARNLPCKQRTDECDY
jgi:hypothetical protein